MLLYNAGIQGIENMQFSKMVQNCYYKSLLAIATKHTNTCMVAIVTPVQLYMHASIL